MVVWVAAGCQELISKRRQMSITGLCTLVRLINTPLSVFCFFVYSFDLVSLFMTGLWTVQATSTGDSCFHSCTFQLKRSWSSGKRYAIRRKSTKIEVQFWQKQVCSWNNRELQWKKLWVNKVSLILSVLSSPFFHLNIFHVYLVGALLEPGHQRAENPSQADSSNLGQWPVLTRWLPR